MSERSCAIFHKYGRKLYEYHYHHSDSSTLFKLGIENEIEIKIHGIGMIVFLSVLGCYWVLVMKGSL